MSGGSYDYLGLDVSIPSLGQKQDQLHRMLERLKGIDEKSSAYINTLALVGTLEFAAELAAELSSVWIAIEWHDSHDWSEDQMLESIREYEEDNNGK